MKHVFKLLTCSPLKLGQVSSSTPEALSLSQQTMLHSLSFGYGLVLFKAQLGEPFLGIQIFFFSSFLRLFSSLFPFVFISFSFFFF